MSHKSTIPDSVETLDNQDKRSYLAGLLGAMMDGYIKQFDFKEITIRQSGASMEVCDIKTKEPLGGYLLIESATLKETMEWVEAKVELYGDN